MSNGLIDLEDEMHRLYLTFFPKGKAVKTGFDALPSKIVNLISQYPEETAHVLASGAYRLTRRVFSQPFTVKRHQPRSPSGFVQLARTSTPTCHSKTWLMRFAMP